MQLRGTLTALVTPFQRDGSVDWAALRRLVEFQLQAGVEGLVPVGSTGESATLSFEEKVEIIARVVEWVGGRVPVVAGTGTNDTRTTIELTRQAHRVGADAALIVCPYYNKPTQQGLYEHFRAVAEAVPIPIVLYNVPGRTAVNMTAETQLRLAEEFPTVVATKEASANLEQVMEILRNAPPHFAVLAGDDMLALPMIVCGGVGVVSVIANYAPQQFGECIRSALAGEWERARTLHYALFPLMRLNFIESNPIPVKAALAMMGLIEEVYRLPLTPLQPRHRELLERALREAGILQGAAV
ncbi:MAG: 4-hydroxy-tetrahydrodipicolinate synthase [Candidatus Kapabacteria bacterium]|nr:4-hydroxy-tetrahydrodipicolinate synthase [Candidatus Kapabacteria bacterium]MDW8011871.1 4-hydroxy-tetrahydrodipicolinate synthase [Bacteroidota bacterium]